MSATRFRLPKFNNVWIDTSAVSSISETVRNVYHLHSKMHALLDQQERRVKVAHESAQKILNHFLVLELGQAAAQTAMSRAETLPEVSALDGFEAYTFDDWDCEGATGVSSAVLDRARLIAREVARYSKETPAAAPGRDGSIGLEWWNGTGRLFIDIEPNSEIRLYLNLGHEEPIEETFQWGSSRLLNRMKELFGILFPQSVFFGGMLAESSTSMFSESSLLEAERQQLIPIFGSASSQMRTSGETVDFTTKQSPPELLEQLIITQR